MPIRTPDQRVRVFVSSTLKETAAERRAVREAIEGLRLTPVMFEQGARPHPPRALYRAYLEQSDIFIGVYWERYGWVAPGQEVSGLEDEYDLSNDRPKLIYIKSPAPNREPRLSKLIARLERDDRASYRPFTDPDELRSLVADDLAVLLTERFSASMPPWSEHSRLETLASLPRPPTRLIDRDGDAARLLDMLADRETRMVTIFGTGGIGKTRLALAVAERAKDRYADGVAYVELGTISDPSLVLHTIATVLGIQEGMGVTLRAGLRARLADARMLIVLDDMEQVTDAAGDLADLLAGAGALQLLVTSRRVLNIRGEHVFTLQPLAVPPAEYVLSPAVELFLELARGIRPGYQPSDRDLAAFAELARRLDGLPLAIELASARLRVLSPHAVLEHMGGRRLEFLQAGGRDRPPRQRTLREAIVWSHSLLSTEAQLLFARLAVFVGGAELEAIEKVTNPSKTLDVLDVLADLVDQSLIRPIGDAVEPRFRMLETIREFAAERLEASGEAADYRDRHATYYLELAERGNAGLGTAQQVEWLNRLGREIDNVRAVLRRSVRRDDAATALCMARAMASYWLMRSSYSEARSWMEHIATLPGARPNERAVARTIGATQAFFQDDIEQLKDLDDDLRLASEPEDQRTVAFAQLLRAITSGASAADRRPQEALTEASRRLEAVGEPLAVGFGLLARSYTARLGNRMDEAKHFAQAAHGLSMRIGESYIRMIASTLLSRAAFGLGDTDGARRHAVESLLGAQRLENVNAVGYSLELWATAEVRDGANERAGLMLGLSERAYRQAGSHPWDTELSSQLRAKLQAALGDRYEHVLAEARDVDFDEALAQLVRSRPS